MSDFLAPFQALFHGEITAEEFKQRLEGVLQALPAIPPECQTYLDDLYRENLLTQSDYQSLTARLGQGGVPDIEVSTDHLPPSVDEDVTLMVAPKDLSKQPKAFDYLDDTIGPAAVAASMPGGLADVATESAVIDTPADMDATIAISKADTKRLFESKKFMDYLDGEEPATPTSVPAPSTKFAEPAVDDRDLSYVGRTLSQRYQLNVLLGKSAYFLVYEARDLQNNCEVVVKIIRPEVKPDSAMMVALDREVKRVQRLKHQSIVTVDALVEENGLYYLIMPKVAGQSLRVLLLEQHRHGMSFKQVTQLLSQVAVILSHAHSRHVIHSDLRPSNIFVGLNGDVFISDFGLSRTLYQYEYEQKRIGLHNNDPRLQALYYTSCQVLDGVEPVPSDDVYSLSCVAYEMLFGQHPYGKVNAIESRRLNIDVQKDKLFGKEQWRAMMKGLAFERGERFSDAKLLLKGIGPKSMLVANLVKVLAGALVLAGIAAAVMAWPSFQAGKVQVLIDEINSGERSLSSVEAELIFFSEEQQSRVNETVELFVRKKFDQGLRKEALVLVGELPASAQNRILQDVDIKNRLVKYYQAEVLKHVDSTSNKVEFAEAEALIRGAKGFYPDSRIFSYMQEKLDREKAEYIARLSELLRRQLTQSDLLLSSSTRHDVFDTIADLKTVDDQAAILSNYIITDAYVAAVHRAVIRKDKIALVTAGLTLLPLDRRLNDLKQTLGRSVQTPDQQRNLSASASSTTTSSPEMSALRDKVIRSVSEERLELPEANNAVFYLKAMIRLDRYDPMVNQARSTISEKYLRLARKARDGQEWDKAQSYINQATEIKLLGE
ncbi:MAG: serine/threonine protein kinase [Methylococcales bacterium]|jgi:serine/threonine protein kinase|nr:serine/threonine protein kinase [Methylococcales bacterium]MBT7445201.1 serine/threonine protein kinase [Methylococcales bacterium]